MGKGYEFLGNVASHILGIVILGLWPMHRKYFLDEINAGCGEGGHTRKEPNEVGQSVANAPFHVA